MELLAYWRLLRRYVWQLGLFICLSSASAAFFTLQQAPQYAATTTLFLNPAVAEPLLGYQNSESVQSLANTYAEFTRTHSFAERVAQDSQIAVTPKTLEYILSTKYVPDTQFFSITVVYPDPQAAQTLANTAAEVLIDANTAWRQVGQPAPGLNEPASGPQNEPYVTELETARRAQLALYNDAITRLQAQVAELQSQPQSDGRDQQVLQVQEQLRGLESNRIDALESLVRMHADAAGDATAAAPASIAVVVDPAPLPVLPQSPGVLRAVAVAFAVSLVAGAGVILLLEYLDQSIGSALHLEAAYGMATLGTLMRPRRGWRRHARSALIPEAPSALAESFQLLHMHMQATARDMPLRSVLVTSALPHEGKTCVAANLAISLARSGKRVILVDADLRRPSLHTLFAVPQEPGLTNALLDQHPDLAGMLHATVVARVQVLPCGTLSQRIAELLGSQRAADLLAELEQLADVVIYDSPPVLFLSDALLIAPHVDGVIQVVRAGKTSAEAVLRGKAALERVHAQIIGPVLNGVVLPEAGAFALYYRTMTRPAHRSTALQEQDNAGYLQQAVGASRQEFVNGRAQHNHLRAPHNGDEA